MNIQLRHFVPVCSCIIRVTAPPSCWVKLMLSATKSVIVTLCASFYPRPSPPSLVTQYSELNTGLLTHQISECQMNKSFQISLSSVHSSSSSSINVSGSLDICFDGRLRPRGPAAVDIIWINSPIRAKQQMAKWALQYSQRLAARFWINGAH